MSSSTRPPESSSGDRIREAAQDAAAALRRFTRRPATSQPAPEESR